MRGGDTSYNSRPPSPSPSLAPKNNSSLLYYGLVVLAIAIYNFIIVKWCSNQQRQLGDADLSPEVASLSRRRLDGSSIKNLGTSFKYKKGEETLKSGYNNHECPVCLSVFVEDEDVRQLPSCRHSFHALCIDMWLYSHLDCPLCRAPVGLSDVHRTLENSSEVLVDPGIHV